MNNNPNEILMQNVPVWFPPTNGASSFNSSPQQLKNAIGYAIQLIVTGTLTGAVKLQGSVDPVTGQSNQIPTNWTDVQDSSQSVTGAGTVVWNVEDVFYNWVRVVYTASSGSGTIAGTINTKGV